MSRHKGNGMVSRFFLMATVVVTVSGCPRPAGPAFFVLSEMDVVYGDSFVIRLDDPDMIAHARELIRHPGTTEAPLVVASIEEGGGPIPNQDYLNGGSAWNWHVANVEGFADFTIEILDGWPTYVNDNLDEWMENTGGMIGFWNYTITEEIRASDLESAKPTAPEYTYTL